MLLLQNSSLRWIRTALSVALVFITIVPALVIPVLLMLLVGIIEFGRAYSTMISLDGASREGARELALGRTAVEVDAATRASTNITIDSITQVPCIAPGHSAKVTVTRQFEFGIPFLPEVTRTLSASSSMRCGL
jgi:Flp pilus assembly protein TadG